MKQKLKSGLEYDVIYGRDVYCYLINHPKIVKFVKRQLNKRIRKEGKRVTNELEIQDMQQVWG